MLDHRLIYSCGYWKDATNLDDAQHDKLELTCKKLNIEPGMRVLDIGCGWGGTARFIAERCGAKVVGITVSREQARLAEKTCAGLPVEIRLQDYRQLNEKFDRILSIGMFEHVGYKNYSLFMRVVRDCLHPDGLFLLHTIGGNHSVAKIDPWINKYIFPNAMLPSKTQLSSAMEATFVLEDWHNFGADYDTTLMHWFQNFHATWPQLHHKYDSRFYRMWKYYLLSCAGSFRARRNQLWQILLSPTGIPGGYRAPR
jgi:cyclopropane-fatty-acyl-phospholipid synthase